MIDNHSLANHEDRQLIQGMLGGHLRQLTSNLMRVVRGAGRPYDIISQMDLVYEWLKRYEVAHGSPVCLGDLPGLFCAPYERPQRGRDDRDARSDAIDDIVNGALQVAASRLVGQVGFERHGNQEIVKGIGAYQEALKLPKANSASD